MKLVIKSGGKLPIDIAKILIDKLDIAPITTRLDLKIKAGEPHTAIIEIVPEEIEVDTKCLGIIKQLQKKIKRRDKYVKARKFARKTAEV